MAALYRAKGFTGGRGEGDRPPPVRGSRAGPRPADPRGARTRSGRARIAARAPPAARSLAFALGAFVPVVPYLIVTGTARVRRLDRPEPRRPVRGRRRRQPPDRARRPVLRLAQVGIGAAAAIVTFVVGSIIGVSVGGLTAVATDIAGRLRAEGLDPSPWSNGPGDRYAAHEHGYDKVIVRRARLDRLRAAGERPHRRARRRRPARAAGRDGPRRVGRARRRHLLGGAPAGGPARRGRAPRRRGVVTRAPPGPAPGIEKPRNGSGASWGRLSGRAHR